MPLTIEVPAHEMYGEIDPKTGRKMFTQTKATKITLEHSLISVAKWEEKWHKPYLNTEKTDEETIDYIRCMTISQNVDPNVYTALTDENLDEIARYIKDPHTATTIHKNQNTPKSKQVITAEILYYWMTTYNMPIEIFQKWHLNRLITLIEVFSIKNSPPKKMSASESMAEALRRDALNDARRKQYHSKG